MPQATSLYFRPSAVLAHVEMRRADRSSACYQTHTHDEFSFGVIDAGVATYRNRHRQKSVYQGMTVMFNPGDAHSCNPDAGQRWSYRMLFVDAGWVRRLQADSSGFTGGDYTPFAVTASDAAVVYRQFDDLFDALEHEENSLEADEKLICFLMQHCFDHRDLRLAKCTPEGPLKRAKELIMDRLPDKIALAAIADVSGLSPYHLIRSFKQAYGQTPHAFQLDQRINRAKQLLKRGNAIVEVAHELGFADQSHFQRNFMKRHAVTPRVYQRSLRCRPEANAGS